MATADYCAKRWRRVHNCTVGLFRDGDGKRMRSADTDSAAERVQVELLRQATVARRATLARSLSRTVLQLTRRAIQERNPSASAEEIGVRFVEACYGPELAQALQRDLEARRSLRAP
jgi:hypothetical protein